MRLWLSIAVFVLVVAGLAPAVGVTAQGGSLVDLLPTAAELGAGFSVSDDRPRTLDEQANGFADPGEAARLLAGWNWQENAFQFSTRGQPAETIDISLTRFADDDGAAQALPFFLEDRAAILGQREVGNLNPIGDEARALDGFIPGGFDYTLYVRSGPLLLRVSATAAQGSPTVSPEQIARGILQRAGARQQPAIVDLAVTDYLPDRLPLADSCAWSDADSKLDVPSFIERFDGVADAATTLPAMGWQDGAYRQYSCDDPPPGGVGWVSLAIHRFADAQAAATAVSFFANARSQVTGLQAAPAPALGEHAAALTGPAVNGTEYTLFVSDGSLLFRVTGVAPRGDPRTDVEAIAAALDERRLGNAVEVNPTVVPIATPPAVIVVATTPTIAPVATATPLPTRAPIPTAPSLPTATPVPTMPPAPVPTAAPTTIPIVIPTATPALQPTAPAGALPTPTPRVIHPPTPESG
jgi:hypothetical protein